MLKVLWEIFPTLNVAKSKETWPKFRKILLNRYYFQWLKCGTERSGTPFCLLAEFRGSVPSANARSIWKRGGTSHYRQL